MFANAFHLGKQDTRLIIGAASGSKNDYARTASH